MERGIPTLLPQEIADFRDQYPISHRLLVHEYLMTRILTATFGQVHALQTELLDVGPILHRKSELIQTGSGKKILDASLKIQKSELSMPMLAGLKSGQSLFGALLMEFGVEVTFSDRRIFLGATEPAEPLARPNSGRWGRRQRMSVRKSGNLLCEVDELLVDEQILREMMPPSDGHFSLT